MEAGFLRSSPPSCCESDTSLQIDQKMSDGVAWTCNICHNGHSVRYNRKNKSYQTTVNIRKPNRFGFRTIDNGSAVKLFGFRRSPKTQRPSWDTKLDRFIYNNFLLYLKLSRLVFHLKTECFRLDFGHLS